LTAALTALEAQTYPRELFEIAVGDNNSPEGADAVRAVVGDRARVTILTEKGAGPARNGALALARFEYLALTDSDCVPHPTWLENSMRALANFDLVFAFDNRDYVENKGFSGTLNPFTRREVFEKAGYFSSLGLWEDVEWCERETACGYRLGYDDSAAISHPARRTWPEIWRKTRRAETEMFHLRVHSSQARIRWLGRTLAYPFSAFVRTPKVLFSKKLRGLSQRLGAIATLYRTRVMRSVLAFEFLVHN